MKYTDAALEAAAKLAARHLRDYRLPDSAIDLIDEAGAVMRLQRLTADARPRPTTRRPRRSRSAALRRRRADIERVVARMARIPGEAGVRVRPERLRTLEESLERVVFGQHEAVHLVAQAIKRSRAGPRPAGSAGRLLPVHRPDRRRQDRARQAAGAAARQRVHPLRHERVHGEARGGAADRRAARDTSASSRAACWSTPCARTRTACVLLDEIEKAHPDIFNVLLQVMDHATLTDNTGRKADFRNVVLILTSNAGSREMSATGDRLRRRSPASDDAAKAAPAAVEGGHRARCSAPSSATGSTPSSRSCRSRRRRMETIVEKFILQLEAQLAERHVAITLTPEARAWLAAKGYDRVFGARPLARVIQREVRDRLTDEILFGAARTRRDGDDRTAGRHADVRVRAAAVIRRHRQHPRREPGIANTTHAAAAGDSDRGIRWVWCSSRRGDACPMSRTRT